MKTLYERGARDFKEQGSQVGCSFSHCANS